MSPKSPYAWLAPLAALTLLGAGCGSSSPSPAKSGSDPFPMMANEQAAKVPSDIPTYPGGFVIAVSGDTKTTHVAQSTPDVGTKVIEWAKAEFTRRGATLKKTSVEGFSTNLIFETADTRYTTRIDQPKDGSAFLTISRGPLN